MKLFRISDFHDLQGLGGMKASARWHTVGSKIVYLADSSPGALLEVLAHLEVDAEDVPDVFSLLVIDAPTELTIQQLEVPTGQDWKQNANFTRRMGDAWLKAGVTALARVPSSIIAHSWNYLLNPKHPSAKSVVIKSVIQERFDSRLFQFGPR